MTEDREEADDIIFEFEALQAGLANLEHHITISTVPFQNGVGSLKGRLIYIRKEC